MKKILPILLILLIPALLAQAQDPVLDEFVYLPLVMGGNGSSSTGCSSDLDGNNTWQTAESWPSSNIVSGCIKDENDEDWFKLEIDHKQAATFEYNFTPSSGPYFAIYVYDSTLELIDNQHPWYSYPFDLASCDSYPKPLEPGTYYIKIYTWLNVGQVDSYQVSLTQTPCPTLRNLTNFSAWDNQDYPSGLAIAGEIMNEGTLPVSGVRMTVNLFDNENNLIDTEIATLFKALAPGEKSCFKVVMENSEGWHHYIFETPTYQYIDSPVEGYEFTGISGEDGVDFWGDPYHRVLGFVTNNSGATIDFPYVIVTLLNPSVIGCQQVSVNTRPLENGQQSSFETIFDDRDLYDENGYIFQLR